MKRPPGRPRLYTRRMDLRALRAITKSTDCHARAEAVRKLAARWGCKRWDVYRAARRARREYTGK